MGFGFSEITDASLSQATFTYNDPNQTKDIQDFAYIGLRKNNIQIKRDPRYLSENGGATSELLIRLNGVDHDKVLEARGRKFKTNSLRSDLEQLDWKTKANYTKSTK